jgi:hypothetical protein
MVHNADDERTPPPVAPGGADRHNVGAGAHEYAERPNAASDDARAEKPAIVPGGVVCRDVVLEREPGVKREARRLNLSRRFAARSISGYDSRKTYRVQSAWHGPELRSLGARHSGYQTGSALTRMRYTTIPIARGAHQQLAHGYRLSGWPRWLPARR